MRFLLLFQHGPRHTASSASKGSAPEKRHCSLQVHETISSVEANSFRASPLRGCVAAQHTYDKLSGEGRRSSDQPTGEQTCSPQSDTVLFTMGQTGDGLTLWSTEHKRGRKIKKLFLFAEVILSRTHTAVLMCAVGGIIHKRTHGSLMALSRECSLLRRCTTATEFNPFTLHGAR